MIEHHVYVFSIRGFQLASLPVHPAWWEERTETQNKGNEGFGLVCRSRVASSRRWGRERLASDSGVTMWGQVDLLFAALGSKAQFIFSSFWKHREQHDLCQSHRVWRWNRCATRTARSSRLIRSLVAGPPPSSSALHLLQLFFRKNCVAFCKFFHYMRRSQSSQLQELLQWTSAADRRAWLLLKEMLQLHWTTED